MGVLRMLTRTFTASPEQLFQQIDNILKSHSLRGCESLGRLLLYLAKQSLDHPDAPLKEYQIATEVYGRPENFDPQSDSTVRVQASRLRAKLGEYYAGEGAGDPILVKIPKGSYHLTFEPKPVELPLPPESPKSAEPALLRSVVVETVPARTRTAFVLLLACLALSLLGLGGLLWTRKLEPATAAASSTQLGATSLAAFWRPFTSAVEEPWVIFSNAAFVGRPETGMRYYSSQRDGKSVVYDHYTGVGEVLAIHALDDAFGTLGRRILVKRGSLFTLDDVKNYNLIFVGSPSENLSLRDIPGTQEFVFQRVATGSRFGDLSIVNEHPKPGESGSYLASLSGAPLTEDYSIVGLVPGIGSGRYVMILAGTTTFGTQGAVEFVCRQESVEKLLRALPNPGSGLIRPFEALLRVKIARGVPVETELVSVRVR
jgi:hypothetical protein